MNKDCANTQVRQSTRARDELHMETSALKTICVNDVSKSPVKQKGPGMEKC